MAILTKDFQVIAVGPTQYFGNVPAHLELLSKYASQNIETNKTIYEVQLHLVVDFSYIGNYQSTPYSINVTGTPSSKTGDAGSGDYSSRIIEGITTEVEHNADGTKSVSMSGSLNFTAWGQTLTVSGSADLPTIPRASSLTATDCYIGSATTITINRASSSFTHTITYSFGSSSPLTGTIATKTPNTSIGWTVPTTFYAKIPNAKTGVCTLTCQTYSGNTLIGTKTTTFTVTVNPATNSPTVSASVIDSNSTTTTLTGDNTKLVKYYSTAQITYSATAKNSASISRVAINGTTVSSSPYSITNVSTNNFSVVGTDTRGYSTTQTLTPTMVNYIPLTINVNFYRTQPTTGQVSLTFNGNYFNGSFGSQSNTLQLKWYYKLKSDSNWTLGGTLVENTDYVIANNSFHSGTSSYEDDIIIGSNFDYRNAYDFKIEYIDKLVSNSTIKPVTKGEPIFWWNDEKVNINELLQVDNNLLLNGYTKGNFIVENIESKNLFNINNITEGQTYSVSNDTLYVGWRSGNAGFAVGNAIENKYSTYTLSFYDYNSSNRFFVRPFDSAGNIITNLQLEGLTYNGTYRGYFATKYDSSVEFTFTLPNTVYTFAIGLVNMLNSGDQAFSNIQVEKGNQATDYNKFIDFQNVALELFKSRTVETAYLGNNPTINDYRFKNGIYGIYNCSQAPTTSIGVLEVLVYSGDWVVQRFTTIGSTSNMWTRCYYNGTTWSNWTQKW